MEDVITMSALGQKRTSPGPIAMSPLPPKADIDRRHRYVRFVPIAAIGPGSACFDNFISAAEHRRRECEAYCLGGLKIDH